MSEGLELGDRIRGCLIGGAVGDALGAPIEFWSTEQIRAEAGPLGIRDFLPTGFGGARGLITDDTQMTLFTVDGLIRMLTGQLMMGAEPALDVLHQAYLRWLQTQDQHGPNAEDRDGWLASQAWLYSRRAPGNTCLMALRAPGAIGQSARNDSKGCGGVMRSAPFGFLAQDRDAIYALTCRAAALTHGHPTGQHASGALALIIHALRAGSTVDGAVDTTLAFLGEQPDAEETRTSLEAALALARDSSSVEPGTIERLGQGWIAEEALAMSAYAALVFPDPDGFRDAMALAVSHGGDSDSTGAICGNILGAAHGLAVVPRDLAEGIEGRDPILTVAEDFVFALSVSGTTGAGTPALPADWDDRYPSDGHRLDEGLE